MKLPKIIYIMGLPGSGKGTQATLLCQKINYTNFSTGNAFREVSRQDSDLGRRVKKTIDNGFLAPPELAAEIVIEAVKQHIEVGEGLVFDGTPRTIVEAELVDDFFAQQDYGRPLVLFLKVEKEEMIERNSKRRFCLGVKKDFPILTEEDQQRCLAEGGKIARRPDDEPAKFATRWEEFQKQTYPVVEKYRSQGIVHEVDGMKSIEEVHQDIMQVISQYEHD